MKNIFSILLCRGLVAGFVACEKDKEFELTKLEVLNESFLTTDSSAVLSCQLKTNATISEAYVHYSINSDFTDYSVAKMISKDGGHSAELRDLQDTTEYYVRYEATNVYSSVINDAWSSFKTKKRITIPIVSTTSASQVMESTATVGGSINSNGGAEVKECGVVYSMSEEPTIADYKVTCSAVMDSYQLNLTWLQAGVNYYVRAYAINEKGVGYGETVVFTTKSVSVSAPSGTENGYDYVDLGLSVKWATMNVGATKPENFGAYYAWGELEGNKKSYSWGNYKYATMNENNVITLLKYNSSNNYGAVDNKTNLDLEDDVAHSQWGGRWRMPTRDELEELLECEWIWTEYNGVSGCVIRSKTNNNSIFMPATGYIEDETRYNKGTNVGIFSSTLYTTNPLRAYGVAMNFSTKQLDIFFFLRYNGDAIRGVVGEEILQIELPTITTTTATQITTNSAVAGGNVTSDGNASVTERGVCISTVSNPTTANTRITAGSGTGEFTCNLTGLQEGTKYYVRAYAVNSKGTAYGEEVVFTTTVAGVPTITTTQPSQVTETTAVSGGNVTSDGGASVTERGVVYSLSASPSIADLSSTIVRSGSGTGTFTCNLSNLQAGTTYYVRAYAVNSKGTAYGEQVSFTTNKTIVLPSVTTSAITQITQTTAVAGGSVTADGNASVTERGVVYSTVSNPVINNIYHTTITSGSGIGSFSVNLTNLVEGTTYYVRAYAVNSVGVSYGEEVSFTTNEQSSTPNDGTENSHEYVDLGLSVKWATCNVGASEPEDYGDYFAWGETTTKSTYDWSTYKYCNGSSSTLTKYNNSSSYGSVDNKTQLELSDDAAAMNWGDNWRMPTDAEMTELRNNCTWTWTTQNGVNGYKVTGTNGNSIFLPAAGYRDDSSLYYAGSYGYYRSSSLITGYPYDAYYLYFNSSYVGWYYYYRYCGQSVRPVCP